MNDLVYTEIYSWGKGFLRSYYAEVRRLNDFWIVKE